MHYLEYGLYNAIFVTIMQSCCTVDIIIIIIIIDNSFREDIPAFARKIQDGRYLNTGYKLMIYYTLCLKDSNL